MKTYMVLDTGANLIKIGKSVNVEYRVKSLQACCGSKLEILHVFDFDIESLLHIKFRDSRKHGEWFDIDFKSAMRDINLDPNLSSLINLKNNGERILSDKTRTKLTNRASKAVGSIDFIKNMKVGDIAKIPNQQSLSETKLGCKRYSESTGKGFHVQPSKGTITRIK